MIHYTELRTAFMDSMDMIDTMLYRNNPKLSRLNELHQKLLAEVNVTEIAPEAPDLEKIDYYRAKRHELLRRYVSVEHETKRKKTAMLASVGWEIHVVNGKLYDLTRNEIYNVR